MSGKKTRSGGRKSSAKKTNTGAKKTSAKKSSSNGIANGHGSEFKQISLREHIKKRSMWAGSKKSQVVDTYVVELMEDEYEDDVMIPVFSLKPVKYPPVMLKINDEVIVNAIDHYVKNPNTVTSIKIYLGADGTVTVTNDGPGIPVAKTKNLAGDEMYTPQLIFSEYLAGSNLDDEKDTERIVGGQNGLGAKITAVFSDLFTVETLDTVTGLWYKQEFSNGLLEIGEPEIKKSRKKKSYTTITYKPKYKEEFKLNIKKFLPTMETLLRMKAYHAAAYTGIKVYFNDELIPVRNFRDFCQMFTQYEVYSTKMTRPNGKFPWDVCIGVTDGKERQCSMVNGVFINSGGSHIKHIQNTLVENLRPFIDPVLKKHKITRFNKNLLLNNVFIFMKGPIPNVEFLSQTKDAVSTPLKDVADYEFPTSIWKPLWKHIENAVMSAFLKKQLGNTKLRANRGVVNVPKYREAIQCRKHPHECGLIVTEGDSASGTAHTGLLSKASPDFNYEWFGVYGIQGVPVNGLKESIEIGKYIKRQAAKKASTKKKKVVSAKKTSSSKKSPSERKQDDEVKIHSVNRVPNAKLQKNERLSSLMKVLGLNFNHTYDFSSQGEKEWKTLRYGFIAGLTDQDLDGFNIFGLLSTFIMAYWPALVKRGFIRRIYTPVVRAYPKKKTKTLKVKEFYFEKDVDEWIEDVGDEYVKTTYNLRYYKGLGSHNKSYGEVKQMFKKIDGKICTFILDERAIRNMEIYYGTNTAPRKIALSRPVTWKTVRGLRVPMSQQFARDTKEFQRDNIVRKLLSLVDGFVRSRRQVFYTARMLGKNQNIKVQGLAGQTIAKADYHHGDASLSNTIIRMAQAYPGARNLPLLRPMGEFGTRDQNYKNSAAARYIETQFNHQLGDKLFRHEDDWVLKYGPDNKNEPLYYVPIIPYVLCETNELPATGWAINVHARNIWDILENVRGLITGERNECSELRIWNKDFRGDIKQVGNRKYFVGDYEYKEDLNQIHITELPPNKASHTFVKGDDKCNGTGKTGIQDLEYVVSAHDYTDLDGVNIVIQLEENSLDLIIDKYAHEVFDPIENYFDLKAPMYDRINLVNEKGEVVEYDNYEQVLEDWFVFRRDLYGVRVEREQILNDLEIQMLEEMQRFSTNYDSYGITSKTKESQVIKILSKGKYKVFNKTLLTSPRFTEVKMLIPLITEEKHGASYNYLLNMSIRDTTKETCEKRDKRIEELKERQEYLTPQKGDKFPGARIWLKELDELETAIRDGLDSDWFYGTNVFRFEDDSDDEDQPKSQKRKRVVKSKRK